MKKRLTTQFFQCVTILQTLRSLSFNNKKKLKPGQNKKAKKFSGCFDFLNPFLQLAAEKKDSKNGAAKKNFGPSYFVTALGICRFTDKNPLMDAISSISGFHTKIQFSHKIFHASVNEKRISS